MSKGTERIILGSGDLYIAEFTGEIPEDSALEVASNKIGDISGGATLEYKPEYYTAEGDMGRAKKTVLTKETATLKSGVLTFNGKTLQKLCSTARVTEASGKRTVKIGGVGNQDGKQYIIRFVQSDSVDGDVRVSIVGKNEAGFSLAYAKDKETVIDAEFNALPIDSEGTLIIYTEEIPVSEV